MPSRKPSAISSNSSSSSLDNRSEEHTSELQSRFDLVCRLLLEKKKFKDQRHRYGDDSCPVHGIVYRRRLPCDLLAPYVSYLDLDACSHDCDTHLEVSLAAPAPV